MKRVARLSFAQGQLMLWILVGSLVAFGAMFVFFRVSGVTLATRRREVSRIEWMPAASPAQLPATDSRYVIADIFDPSLMSLPNGHGFSREVWRRKLEATQRNLGWNDEPAFLDARPPEPLTSLLEPTPVADAVLAVAEKNPGSSEESSDSALTESPAPLNRSVLRIAGALESRAINRMPPLPTIPGSTPLRATQVRVAVAPDGLVRYAMLDRSSGSDAVDTQALALARQIRFEVELGSDPTAQTWGVVRFLWATANGDNAAHP